jgi:hypothetical protein
MEVMDYYSCVMRIDVGNADPAIDMENGFEPYFVK